MENVTNSYLTKKTRHYLNIILSCVHRASLYETYEAKFMVQRMRMEARNAGRTARTNNTNDTETPATLPKYTVQVMENGRVKNGLTEEGIIRFNVLQAMVGDDRIKDAKKNPNDEQNPETPTETFLLNKWKNNNSEPQKKRKSRKETGRVKPKILKVEPGWDREQMVQAFKEGGFKEALNAIQAEEI